MNLGFAEPYCTGKSVKTFFKRYPELLFAMRVSFIYIAYIMCSLQLLLAHSSNSQSLDSINVTVELQNESLKDLFKKIEEQTGLLFAYQPHQVESFSNLTIPKATRSVKATLDLALDGKSLSYRKVNGSVIIFQPEVETPVQSNTVMDDMVKGVITNTEGSVMPGVNIIIKGTTIGTSSNSDGKYEIVAGVNDLIVFSFIGYRTFESQVGERTIIDVVMEEDIATLKEVVINAGYYNVKKKESPGNISKVTSEIISKQPVTNVLGTLQGRMPGVYVQQASGVPGGEFKIQIRGRNSLRDDGNEPLYIVDGVPFSVEKTFSDYATGAFGIHAFGTSSVSPLTAINPTDIESIEVLKDADATAIYGSRGANGVVLITTKKGKPGKTKVDINIYSGAGSVRRIPMLNTQQYLAARREAFANDGVSPNAISGTPGYSPELMIWDTTRYTNWQKELLGHAETISAQSSITGGGDNTQFLFSIGYRKESSVYPNDFGYQKGSFHLTINHQSPDKKFSIGINTNGAKDKNDQPYQGLYGYAINLAPNAPPLYDENGGLNWENSTWENPLAQIENRYHSDALYFTGNTVVGYEIVEGLQFKTSFGFNYQHSKERTKYPHTSTDPAKDYTSAQSYVHDASGENQSWVIEPEIDWERNISKGKLTALVGATFQDQQLKRKADRYIGFPTDALMDNLASATTTENFEFVQTLYRYSAAFGRLNYNWDGKYILNLTVRRDGSSRFGPGKQFATFGAIGAAWIFSNESFIKDKLQFISFGKIRSSYGTTGNDQIGNYQYLDTYATNTAPSINNQYQGVTWINPTKLFNADYAWEVNKKFEAGLELGMFEDRVSLEVSYFNNRSSNQLVNYAQPQTTGFTYVLANLPAIVQNSGVEVELQTNNLADGPVKWTTSFNITIPRNKLLEFPNLETSTYANRYVIGQPLGISKTYELTGVDSETGLFSFRDFNGDGVITPIEDRTKITFVGQDFYGGMNNSLTYKGWTLDFFFQFVKQTGRIAAINLPGGTRNVPAYMLDRKIWHQPGDVAEIQRLYSSVDNNIDAYNAQQIYNQSDAQVGDASFIRLKNVSLSYQFPRKWTGDVLCRIYMQGQNLWLITNYEGADPENQFFEILPPLRMFTAGLHLTL